MMKLQLVETIATGSEGREGLGLLELSPSSLLLSLLQCFQTIVAFILKLTGMQLNKVQFQNSQTFLRAENPLGISRESSRSSRLPLKSAKKQSQGFHPGQCSVQADSWPLRLTGSPGARSPRSQSTDYPHDPHQQSLLNRPEHAQSTTIRPAGPSN